MRRRSGSRHVARRLAAVLLAVLAGAVALGACGGGDDDGGDSGGDGETVQVTNGEVTVDAEDVAFNVTRIEAAPGDLDVTLVEKGVQDHTFVVQNADGEKINDTLAVSSGDGSASGTFPLEPGEYDFFCDVPGHRGQGMEGTIVVE